MTTLTIQAADTASAMDEIEERLGKDALILSTTKKHGKVVMQATNGADLPSPSPKRAASDFSHMYNAGICLLYTSPSPRDMRRSRMPSSA